MTDLVEKVVELEFVLRCSNCMINAFYIVLNSNNPYDIRYFECVDCGKIMSFENE
jgi:hypothetical protein